MTNSPSFQRGRLLKELCTLGIGGPARYFIAARTVEDLSDTLRYCHSQGLRVLILGKGSNSLFDDRGFDGVVIHNKIDFFKEVQPGIFHVGGGYSFSRLGAQTARQGWSGLEFASGIPASVGGAVFMNAGANGTETCETLLSVDYVDEQGKLHTLDKNALTFSYRLSPFQALKGAIAGATFRLTSTPDARKKQLEIINARMRTQPYTEKSAGCVFRNPPGCHAGALIDRCGLKGYRLGGIAVSERHANFLINTGEGSSREMLALAEEIRLTVKKQCGIELEKEVRYIPYQDDLFPR